MEMRGMKIRRKEIKSARKVDVTKEQWQYLLPLIREQHIHYDAVEYECWDSVYVSIYVNKEEENYINSCIGAVESVKSESSNEDDEDDNW